MINNFSMLNSISPLALILIAGGILLVAAGIIVYFFLFHKKLVKYIQDKSVEKAKDKQAKEQASGFVADFFKKEQRIENETEKKMSDEERRAMFVQTRQAALNAIEAEIHQTNKAKQNKNRKGGK